LSMTPAGEHAAFRLGPNGDLNFAFNLLQQQGAATNNPILIQLRANLATAFTGALLVTFLGFLVHFLVAARRRLAEHAILQANGLEPNDVRRGIALEQLVVTVFGLLVGLALAAVAVAVLVPALQFGSEVTAVIPPTVIRVDWA